MDVSELHSWWEVPSIAHFFSLFNESFGLVDFDIEELEEWLINAETDAGCPFLIDLLCKVMKGCYNNKRKITHANFEFHFRELIKKRWELSEGKVNPFYENDMNFKKLPARTKVEMIQSLCDYRLTADDVIDKLKYFETDDLRKVPVGRDSTGALYWYFYGTRLYREVPAVKHTYTSTHEDKVKQSKRGRRKKQDLQEMDKQSALPRRGGVSSKTADNILTGRRRGRKPRRVEEIQSQGTESDSSPASSPARRRGRPMRRGRPPQLRMEAVVQSDQDSTVTSSTPIREYREEDSLSPPKLTPQMSADSRQTSDVESTTSTHKGEPVLIQQTLTECESLDTPANDTQNKKTEGINKSLTDTGHKATNKEKKGVTGCEIKEIGENESGNIVSDSESKPVTTTSKGRNGKVRHRQNRNKTLAKNKSVTVSQKESKSVTDESCMDVDPGGAEVLNTGSKKTHTQSSQMQNRDESVMETDERGGASNVVSVKTVETDKQREDIVTDTSKDSDTQSHVVQADLKKGRNQLNEQTNDKGGVTCQPSDVTDQQSDVTNQKSDVTNQKSDVTGQKSDVSGQKIGVTGQPSDVTDKKNDVTGQPSDVTGQQSVVCGKKSDHVIGQSSDVTGQQSDVTGQQSDDVTGQQSDDVTAGQKSHDVTAGQKSHEVTGQQRDGVTADQKSDDLTCQKSDDVTGQKSDITGQKSDITGQKSYDVTGQKSNDVTGQKCDDVTGQKSDDINAQKSKDVTGQKNEVTNQRSNVSIQQSNFSGISITSGKEGSNDTQGTTVGSSKQTGVETNKPSEGLQGKLTSIDTANLSLDTNLDSTRRSDVVQNLSTESGNQSDIKIKPDTNIGTDTQCDVVQGVSVEMDKDTTPDRSEVSSKQGDIKPDINADTCKQNDVTQTISVETGKQGDLTKDTKSNTEVKLGKDTSDGTSKQKSIIQSAKLKTPVTSGSNIHSKKNMKSKKKGLRSVEEIVSKLKTDSIANIGIADVSSRLEEGLTKGKPPKLKAEPPGPLGTIETTGKVGIRVTETTLTLKCSEVNEEKEVGMEISEHSGSEQTKPESDNESPAGTSVAGAKSSDTSQSRGCSSEKSETSEAVSMEISEVEGDLKSRSLPAIPIAEDDGPSKEKVCLPAVSPSLSTDNPSPSLDNIKSDSQPDSKTIDPSCQPRLLPAMKDNTSSGYSNEPLDLSNKPSQSSRSTSPATAIMCNGVIEEQTKKSSESPLNLSRPSKDSAQQGAKSGPSVSQVDGVWDSLSSDSEREEHCYCCSLGDESRYSQVGHFVKFKPSNLVRSSSRKRQGKGLLTQRHTLGMFEQLDGVTDPIGDKDSSDPGGGTGNTTETARNLVDTMATDGASKCISNIQYVKTITSMSDNVIEISPAENNLREMEWDGSLDSKTYSKPETVEHETDDAANVAVGKGDQNGWCINSTEGKNGAPDKVKDSLMVDTLENYTSAVISASLDSAMVEDKAYQNTERSINCNVNKELSDSSTSYQIDHRSYQPLVNTITTDDLCLFDMECEDVDGESENTTRNKIIIPKIRSSKTRNSQPELQVSRPSESQATTSKRHAVQFVDLTCESDNEVKITGNPAAFERVCEKAVLTKEPPTSAEMVSIACETIVNKGPGEKKPGIHSDDNLPYVGPARVEKEYLKLPIPCITPARVEKEYLKLPNPCVGPSRKEKEYLKLPNPASVKKSSTSKSFTDSFSEFLTKIGANKPISQKDPRKTDVFPNGGNKCHTNIRVKVEVESGYNKPGVSGQGRGRGRQSSHTDQRSTQSGKSSSRSRKSHSSEEDDELTEEVDDSLAEEEESGSDALQTNDGDYMPPVMLKQVKYNRDSSKANKDVEDNDNLSLRRSSRRASKKVDYTVDLQPSSPSTSEDLSSRPDSRLSDESNTPLSENTEQNEKLMSSSGGKINHLQNKISNIQNHDTSSQEFEMNVKREPAYDSDTEPEDQESSEITKIEPLTEHKENHPAKRRKKQCIYDTDESSDYIISDDNDSQDDHRLSFKRGKRKGKSRGLKQTIDYICSQLDGQNDSSGSSETDLDAPLAKFDKKSKGQNRSKGDCETAVEPPCSDGQGSGDEKPSGGRRTRSETQKTTTAKSTRGSVINTKGKANNTSSSQKNQKKTKKVVDQTISDTGSSPEKEGKTRNSVERKGKQGKSAETKEENTENKTDKKEEPMEAAVDMEDEESSKETDKLSSKVEDYKEVIEVQDKTAETAAEQEEKVRNKMKKKDRKETVVESQSMDQGKDIETEVTQEKVGSKTKKKNKKGTIIENVSTDQDKDIKSKETEEIEETVSSRTTKKKGIKETIVESIKMDQDKDIMKTEETDHTDQENVVSDKEMKEASPESPQVINKKRRTRARKTAVCLLPVRTSPRKCSNTRFQKSIIERLKDEEMISYTSSETEGYSEPVTTTAGKRRARPKRVSADSEDEEEGSMSEGTEDYWSEEEELLKVEDRVKDEFDQQFLKKKSKKWSLICNKLDDWKCLAKKFKDSEVKCEKQLYACIMKDFLPELPKLYSYKDEQIMGRARELAKLKEKIRKQSLGEGDTETSSDEDRERLSEEVKREQFFKWQKEEEERELNRERERLKKDRAKRAKNRELRAEGHPDVGGSDNENEGEEEGETTEEEEVEESDRRLRSRERRTDRGKLIESRNLDESTLEALTKVLRAIQDHEDSWIFTDQVEEEYAPGYYDIIEEPMWLGRIEEKLESGLYQAVQEFEADFQLMWDNCEDYNGSDSEYTEASRKLEKVLKKAIRKHLPRYRSSCGEVQSPGRQKQQSPVRGSSKRSHSQVETAQSRAKRNASSQARDAMKYAEMSSDEFDEQDQSLVSDDEDGEENTLGREGGGPTLGKKRKRDSPDITPSMRKKGSVKNKAGLRVAPAPEKCGEGGPLDIVEIQKVDRDNFAPGYTNPPGHMGSSGQMMGAVSEQWQHPGMRPPAHMGTAAQGCYPVPGGMNYMGSSPYTAGGRGGGVPEQGGLDQQGNMRPPNQHARMGGMHGGVQRPPTMGQHRYPAHMTSPNSQYGGQYPSMHGQYPSQRPQMVANSMPPPGYGYNRQMNPMMQQQQNMSPQNTTGLQRPPGMKLQHQSSSDTNIQAMHSSLGSPNAALTDSRVQSPKSVDSPALSQRSSKVCSPNYPQRSVSPGIRSAESDPAVSPSMSSPRSDTPGSTSQVAAFPGSPNMRLSSPGMPHRRESSMGSPHQHMPPPAGHPHSMGYNVTRSGLPAHMMEYGHRPGSPMMRPGHASERFPHPAGYGGRYPGSPQMNMYEPGTRAINRMPSQGLTRGPPAVYPGNQPPLQPPRESFTQPGSFTSMLQDLEDDMPPPPPPQAGSAAALEGFNDMAGKQQCMPPGMQMDSTGPPVRPPNNYRYGGGDMQALQRPNMASPNHNAPSNGNPTGHPDTGGSVHAPYSQQSTPSQNSGNHLNSSAVKSNTQITSSSSKMSESRTDIPMCNQSETAETTQDVFSNKTEEKIMSDKASDKGNPCPGGTENVVSAGEGKASELNTLTATREQSGKLDTKGNGGDLKPSDKGVESSSLMADLLSPDYRGNTKANESSVPPSNNSSLKAESTGSAEMMGAVSQAGSMATTESQNLGVIGSASHGRMEGCPYRHPQPSMGPEFSPRPPPHWGAYGSRSMQGPPRMPTPMSPTNYPTRMPNSYLQTRNPEPVENSQRSMMSPGSRGLGEMQDSMRMTAPSGTAPAAYSDITGQNFAPNESRSVHTAVADNVLSSNTTNQTGVPSQTTMSSNVPPVTSSFFNAPGDNSPPYTLPNQTSRNDSMMPTSGGNPSLWNTTQLGGTIAQGGGNMPQRTYPMGNVRNMSPDNRPSSNPAMKYPNHPMTPQQQGGPIPGTPSGPTASGQMGFNPNNHYYSQVMHTQHSQRMFSPQPHGQFSPNSDISGHSNTMSGDQGRAEEMEEEEFSGKPKKGKGKGKAKPAAKKKATKKEASELGFQEPPEKKSKPKKSKKKKSEPVEESSNDSDMFMPMPGQKQGFLQQPPPFGNQGAHPFMAGGQNPMPNTKLPYGHPSHPMSSFNMPQRPRQPNPNGSLAGMMNMVNQMPMPEQESVVGGMRPDQQGGFMGEPGMPAMGMYPGGESMNPAYPQMGQHPQFTDTQDYMRRFQQQNQQQQQQAYRMHGNHTVSKPEMFAEQSLRQMGSNTPQEVPIVPSVSQAAISQGLLHPNSLASPSPVGSANQTPPPMTNPSVKTTMTTASSPSLNQGISSVASPPKPMGDVSRHSSDVSSELQQQAQASSSLQSTAESCSKSGHTAIISSSESQKSEQSDTLQNTQSSNQNSESSGRSCTTNLDSESNILKTNEESTGKELISSDTNPSLMLTPPESPKSASCSTNVSSGKVTEALPQQRPDVQSAGPQTNDRTSAIVEDSLHVSPNQNVPQKNVNVSQTPPNVMNEVKSDNTTPHIVHSDTKSGMNTQDSGDLPADLQQSTPSHMMDISTNQQDSSNSSKAPVGSPFAQPPDIHQRQQTAGFNAHHPNPDPMKMMPSGMGHPAGMQPPPGYMSQYYGSNSQSGGPTHPPPHHQGMMMSSSMSHSEMQRHPGYMMQQQMAYQHQQSMMGMHSRMGMSPHMVHPGMQQMYSYMQSGGQMGGQMGSHMMPGHMMQSHGASSPLQPSSTSSPGPQYQQL